MKRLATARFELGRGKAGRLRVDLLFASSGIEPEVVAAAEELEILPDCTLPVAQRGHLLALKLLAHDEDRRPRDRQDILALLAHATEEDLRRTREAVALITERGFHRDKNLAEELQRFELLAERLGRPGQGSP